MRTDFLTRGGLWRFKGDHWSGYPAPSWEWAYASSYVLRPIILKLLNVSENSFFLSVSEFQERLSVLEPEWNSAFERIADVAGRHGISSVMFVRRPEHHEIVQGKYDADFSFFEEKFTIDGRIHHDLLPFYLQNTEQGKTAGMYFWPKDGHHNSRGYQLLSEGVLKAIGTSFPELFLNEPEPTDTIGIP